MKRILFRLSALSAVVVVGMIAIAQAQRSVAPPAVDDPGTEPALTEESLRPIGADGNTAPVALDEGTADPSAADPFAAAGRALSGRSSRYSDAADRYEASGAETDSQAEMNADGSRAGDRYDPSREMPIPVGPSENESAVVPAAHREIASDRQAISAGEPDEPAPLGNVEGAIPLKGAQADSADGGIPLAPLDGAAGLPPADVLPTQGVGAEQVTPRLLGEPTPAQYPPPGPAGQSLHGAQEPRMLDQAPAQAPGELDAGRVPVPVADPQASGGIEGSGKPGDRSLEGAQTPALAVMKEAPADVQVGKPAIFRTRIKNVGKSTATQVELRDEVPQGTTLSRTEPSAVQADASGLVWSLGDMRPGDELVVEMEVVPQTEGEIGSVATLHWAAQCTARAVVTRPHLTLEVAAPSQVLIGEDIMFTIKLSNLGTGPATGVTLQEPVPEVLQHEQGPELEYEIGSLAPGEQRELTLAMKAVKPGQAVNVLTVRDDASQQAQVQTAFEVSAPALDVQVEGPKRRYLDRQATYTVSVSNPGTAAAQDVELVTYLPRGLQFVEANNAGEYNAQTRTVHWLLEALPPQQTGTVELVALPVDVGEQRLRVEGRAQRGLTAQSEQVIEIDGVAAILFEVVDVEDPVEVGGKAAFEVRVLNQGSKAASNLRIVAKFPNQLRPTGGSGPARYSIQGDSIIFDPLPQLAPKADTTFHIEAQADQPGDMRVSVQLMTDDMQEPVTKEESTRVYADE